MKSFSATLALIACAGVSLGGCSGGFTNPLTTQSIPASTNQTVAAAPKIDPACYALSQRVDALRREGVTERLEKASEGKSTTVAVKRSSLAQAAELDKANAEFQSKCSVFGPRPVQSAAVAPVGTGIPPANSAQVVPANTPRTTGAIAPPVVVQQQ